MSQTTPKLDDEDESYSEIREDLLTGKGVDRSTLDVGGDDHALSGMESERRAPIEAVAKSAVERYDEIRAFYREYLSNAHTACIQRAKVELENEGFDTSDMGVREVLDLAAAEVGYEPVIEVVRNEDPDDFSLKIKDNGVGISSRTAYAIRDIGLSGWQDDETTNGQFGIGTMSGFLPVDHYGEFDMTTRSVLTDENYRARWKLTDLDKLPGERDGYGTTFTFPYFTDEAQEIDDYEAVREFSEGMVVPVIYEHYDEDGTQNGIKSDDFSVSYIEDRYADDSPAVSYENDYTKVVWSPDSPEGWSSNIKTWCGYQPIDRNDSGFSTNSFAMPSAFDLRVKVEDGSIVHVPESADQSLVGKVPVSRNRWEHLPEEQRDGFVIRSEVPDDAIVAPEPTDDRDRFESKHVDDFVRHYSTQLKANLIDEVGDIIESIDGLEDLPDLSDRDRRLLLVGIENYVDVYRKNEPERVQDDIEDTFGVRPDEILASNVRVVKSEFGDSVSDGFAEAVGMVKQSRLGGDDEIQEMVEEMTDTVSLAPRGTARAGQANNRDTVKAWKVLQDTGEDGTVYMAKTLSCQRKVELAWELHEDNQVVRVKRYGKWADTFGWEKLKELPNRNFDRLNHDFDEDWLYQWDPGYGDDDGSGGGQDLSDYGFDHERAKKRQVAVRTGTGNGSYTELRGSDVLDRLDEDKAVTIGYNEYDTVVLYRETDGYTTSAGRSIVDKELGIAYAVVPNYVYDYLIRAENAMTEQEYIDREKNKTIEYYWHEDGDDTGKLVDLDERDVFVGANDELIDPIEERGLTDEFVDAVTDRLDEIGVDECRSITFVSSPTPHKAVIHNNSVVDQDPNEKPTCCNVETSGFGSDRVFGYGYHNDLTLEPEQVFFDCVLPDMDRSAPEWNYLTPSMDDSELVDALQDLEDAGGFESTNDADLPAHVGTDHYDKIEPDQFHIQQTMAKLAVHTDWFDDDDGGDV